MSYPPDDRPRREPPGPPAPNMARELIGSVLGALAGAAIAQVLTGGNRDIIVSGAIAGAFVGPGVLVAGRRAWQNYQDRGAGPH
ncbi:MAG TPA: hypothetical protein VII06_29155 [Chloroflexota bacterium]